MKPGFGIPGFEQRFAQPTSPTFSGMPNTKGRRGLIDSGSEVRVVTQNVEFEAFFVGPLR